MCGLLFIYKVNLLAKLSADQVQGTACLKPFDLLLVVGVVYCKRVGSAVFVVEHHG